MNQYNDVQLLRKKESKILIEYRKCVLKLMRKFRVFNMYINIIVFHPKNCLQKKKGKNIAL